MNLSVFLKSFFILIILFLIGFLILEKQFQSYEIIFTFNLNVLLYIIMWAIFISLLLQFDIMLVVVNFQHYDHIENFTQKFEIIDKLSKNCNGNYLAYSNLHRLNIKFLNDINKQIDILKINEIIESGEFFDLLKCINKVDFRVSPYEFYNYLVKFTISDPLFFHALFYLHSAFDLANHSEPVLRELIENSNQIDFILSNQKFSFQNNELYIMYVFNKNLIEFINYVEGDDLSFERFLYFHDHRITNSKFIIFLKNSILKYGARNLQRRHKISFKSSNSNDNLNSDNSLELVDF